MMVSWEMVLFEIWRSWKRTWDVLKGKVGFSWVALHVHEVGGTKLEVRHDISAGRRLQNPEKAERRATEMNQGLKEKFRSLED